MPRRRSSLVSCLIAAALLLVTLATAATAAEVAGAAAATHHVMADPPAAAAAAPRANISSQAANVRVLLLTDCAKYQDWQAIAAAFAWRELGQPGVFTRVASCAEKDRAAYPKAMLDYVDTHMAPHVAWNAQLKDYYAAYNKPIAVKDWLEHNPHPKQEYVLLLDADMLLRRPFLPEEFNVSRGWAVAGHYSYMKGVANDLAVRHIPEVTPYNDTVAGPVGRRGDVVGAPYFMHMDDARKLAPLWYDYTVRVRNDTKAYIDAGDAAATKKNPGRVWIAEMYGYTFGAAKIGLRHRWSSDFMLYPGYTPPFVPRNIHYGLKWKVNDWSFKKHFYLGFNVHKCPPWNLTVEHPQEGIFPPPPHPDALRDAKDYLQEFRDIISVHTMAQINAAICHYHRRNCPPSQQLTDVCGKAEELYAVAKARYKMLAEHWSCVDHHPVCPQWAKRGECHSPAATGGAYTRDHCRPSCGLCTPKSPPYVPLPERLKATAAAEAAHAAAAHEAATAAEATQEAVDQEAKGHAAAVPGGGLHGSAPGATAPASSAVNGGGAAGAAAIEDGAAVVGDLLTDHSHARSGADHDTHPVALPDPHAGAAGMHASAADGPAHAAEKAGPMGTHRSHAIAADCERLHHEEQRRACLEAAAKGHAYHEGAHVTVPGGPHEQHLQQHNEHEQQHTQHLEQQMQQREEHLQQHVLEYMQHLQQQHQHLQQQHQHLQQQHNQQQHNQQQHNQQRKQLKRLASFSGAPPVGHGRPLSPGVSSPAEVGLGAAALMRSELLFLAVAVVAACLVGAVSQNSCRPWWPATRARGDWKDKHLSE